MLSSRRSAETGAPLLDGASGVVGGGRVFSGLLGGRGLSTDRGRFRVFVGVRGKRSPSALGSVGGGTLDGAPSETGPGEFPEGDNLCRFGGGGDLEQC